MLNLIDEFTRECLAIRIDRKLKSTDVIDVVSDLFILRGVPGPSAPTTVPSSSPKPFASGSRRSAPGPHSYEPAALGRTGTARASTPSFGTTLERRDLLQPRRGRIVIEGWRQHYNTKRPHSSLGYRPPAQPSCRGRLRHPNPLRRPSQTSPASPPCIRFEPGHLMGAGQRRRSPVRRPPPWPRPWRRR